MTNSCELLLLINLMALTAVCIHCLIAEKADGENATPKKKIRFKKAKPMSDEEKRNAEILEEIAAYNGTEVRK